MICGPNHRVKFPKWSSFSFNFCEMMWNFDRERWIRSWKSWSPILLGNIFRTPEFRQNWYTFRSLTAGFTKKLLSPKGKDRAPTIIFVQWRAVTLQSARTAPRRLERSAKEHNGEKLGGKLDFSTNHDGKSAFGWLLTWVISLEKLSSSTEFRDAGHGYICIVLYLYTMILVHSRDLTYPLPWAYGW